MKNILLIVFLLLFSLPVRSQRVSVDDSVATLVSDTCNTRLIEHTDFNKLHFKKAKNRRINLGLTGNEYHFIILKINAREKLARQYLSINNTSLDRVQMYKIQPGNTPTLLYEGGQLIPYQENRNYVWHTTPIDVNLTPSLYLIAIQAAQKNINIQYSLQNHDDLLKQYVAYDRLVFFYIGIAFMISAIVLLALFLFKKKVFAVYFGYMLCISFWIIDHYGRVFPYLYPGTPVMNEISKPLSSLGAAFLLLTVQKLIFRQNLRNNQRLLHAINYLRYFLIAILVSVLLLLFPAINSSLKAALIILWHTGLILSIGLIAFIPLYFIRSGKLAKIFSLAMLVICLTTLVQLFANSGFIKSYFISEHGMALGSLMENSIMAFGLLYGLLIERKNKELQLLALEEQQTETLKKLISVQDNERKRIAGDLHDNIGPLLAALKINFRRIININEGKHQSSLVEKTEAIIDDSITEIRNVAHNLMPKGLSSKGLINTLEDYFENIQQLYSKKLLFNHQVHSIFEPELQINIYRIICELVLNAARHSNAEIIKVCIMADQQIVSINIADNGQGFPCKQNGNKKSLGIQSAESRVNYLKGTFSLVSEAGQGTTVHIEISL